MLSVINFFQLKKTSLFNWLLLEGLAQTFEEQVAQDTDKLPWSYYDWFYNFDRRIDLPVNFLS